MTMLDIQGVEDFHGDMDFKVGGTRRHYGHPDGYEGRRADLRDHQEAFENAARAPVYLDEIMAPVIAEPRASFPKLTRQMLSMKIDVDKIPTACKEVIQEICANCNAKIDIEEDGSVFISAIDIVDAERAVHHQDHCGGPEIGAIYKEQSPAHLSDDVRAFVRSPRAKGA